jgi:hypothetical protein
MAGPGLVQSGLPQFAWGGSFAALVVALLLAVGAVVGAADFVAGADVGATAGAVVGVLVGATVGGTAVGAAGATVGGTGVGAAVGEAQPASTSSAMANATNTIRFLRCNIPFLLIEFFLEVIFAIGRCEENRAALLVQTDDVGDHVRDLLRG